MKRILAALLALAACASEPAPQPVAQLLLTGEITRADHQTYREIPFTVPKGTEKITIDFSYTGKENRTVIDIGLRDPQGQRGWSGSNKSHIEISEFSSTPSYRAAPVQPGEWKLVLGIPSIREGQTASYTASVSFSSERVDVVKYIDRLPNLPPQLPATAAWYRGDFHTHTAHSDGSCGAEDQRRPCPAVETVIGAHSAGLNFVAITDHNTITQQADFTQLQKLYPQILLIPGTEITTFNGHANVVGNTDFLDFQLGSPRLPTLAKLFDQVDAANAFISVNHPSLPSGEACMGCGWTVKDTDWSRVTAIEVINGASMRTSGPEGAFSGIAFWEARLKEGHRITAIAGSDNHDATDTTGAKQSPVGTPATVVFADGLSTQSIIAGVKSGRVFIDVAGLPEAALDMEARNAGQTVVMGGEILLGAGEIVTITVRRTSVRDAAQTVLVSSNVTVGPPRITRTSPIGANQHLTVDASLKPGATSGYVRPEIRDASGKLLLLGNPIYFRRAG